MTAIFLDIDGVLNDHRRHANGYCPIVADCVDHLNTILHAVPGAQIVLTSAWRYAFKESRAIEALLCCHGVFCARRVSEPTTTDEWAHGGPIPDLESLPKSWWQEQGLLWRKMQIELALRVRPIGDFVVLDDLPLDVPRLVRTDGLLGLTAQDADQAVSILRHGWRP